MGEDAARAGEEAGAPLADGAALLAALAAAGANLARQAEAIDALNVFPVPDGDTGKNMTVDDAGRPGGRPRGAARRGGRRGRAGGATGARRDDGIARQFRRDSVADSARLRAWPGQQPSTSAAPSSPRPFVRRRRRPIAPYSSPSKAPC